MTGPQLQVSVVYAWVVNVSFLRRCHTCQAVAFLKYGGLSLRGKVADMRSQLADLVPAQEVDDGAPEYPTQDDVFDDPSADSGSDCDRVIVHIKSVEDITVGEIIEVYWKGEKEWYEGEVTGVDLNDGTYEVLYKTDSSRLWHTVADYPCRYGT